MKNAVDAGSTASYGLEDIEWPKGAVLMTVAVRCPAL